MRSLESSATSPHELAIIAAEQARMKLSALEWGDVNGWKDSEF